MIHSVYKTTNNINGKFYFGIHSSEDPNDSYLGSGVALNEAIKKYGSENFTKEVLKICESREEASKLEKLYVEQHLGDRNCYNLTEGGYGTWAHTWDDPYRKFRAARASRLNNGFKGKTHTEEAKRKIGAAKKLDSTILEQRIKDYKEDDKRYGLNSRMAKKWGITSQKAGSFMKHNNFEQYK